LALFYSEKPILSNGNDTDFLANGQVCFCWRLRFVNNRRANATPLLRWYNNPMRSQIESLLLTEVKLPGQYIGGEIGSIIKPKGSVKGRLCFAFPNMAIPI
jgi:hypothetical protein